MLNPKIHLWSHQQAMVKYMIEQGHGILNAGMGTGKTLTSLAYVDQIQAKRVLIVAKSKHSLNVWRDAIEYALDPFTLIIDDNTVTIETQALNLHNLGYYDRTVIYLTTYPRVWRPSLLKQLLGYGFDVVIADESHKLNAPNSATSKALWKLGKKIERRWGLTGTLISNEPMGVFGQARFIDDKLFNFPDGPNLLRAYYRFRDRYCYLRPINPRVAIITGYKNLDEYNKEVGKFVYKVNSRDVLDLPPESHIKQVVHLPKAVMKAYKSLKDEAIISLEGSVLLDYNGSARDNTMSAKNILAKIGRLRQLAGGTVTTDSGEVRWVHDDKLDAVEDIIDGLPADEPAVIFCAYTAEVQAVKKRLETLGSVSELSGSKDEITEWQQGHSRFLVVQISTGAEAIDLTRSGYVIYYSLSYSLSEYEQSLARINRPGQTRDHVFYYYILAASTIDTLIFKALESKQSVAKTVLDSLEGWNEEDNT